MDELFTYGHFTHITHVIESMNQQGATFALGEMLDHVAPGGALRLVTDSADIWSQFPLMCPVVSDIAKGLPVKVTLHKGFLRTGAGHHHIVEPYLAKAYYSSECKGVLCELVMKQYKQRAPTDMYNLTPYSRFTKQYEEVADFGWQAKRWTTWTKVHHFKWHASVLDNLILRMVRDSGNCILNVNEDNCQPVFQFWKEVARQVYALNATHSINITSLHCQEGVDTLWSW